MHIHTPLTAAVIMPLGLLGTDRIVVGRSRAAFTFAAEPMAYKPYRIDIDPFQHFDFMIEGLWLAGRNVLMAPLLAGHLHDLRWAPLCTGTNPRIEVFNRSGADREFNATLHVRVGTDHQHEVRT